MTTKVIEIKTSEGKMMYLEIDEDIEPVKRESIGGYIAGGGIETAVETIEDFDKIGAAIAEVCSRIQDKFLSSVGKSKPTELNLEFGVKLAGEAGVPLLTKGSVEGTFQVKAKWDFASKTEG